MLADRDQFDMVSGGVARPGEAGAQLLPGLGRQTSAMFDPQQ